MNTVVLIVAILLCIAALANGFRGVQEDLPGNLLMLILPGLIGVITVIGALLYSVGMRGDHYPIILLVLAASVFVGNSCALWQGRKNEK